jgi:hypothetical protein
MKLQYYPVTAALLRDSANRKIKIPLPKNESGIFSYEAFVSG